MLPGRRNGRRGKCAGSVAGQQSNVRCTRSDCHDVNLTVTIKVTHSHIRHQGTDIDIIRGGEGTITVTKRDGDRIVVVDGDEVELTVTVEIAGGDRL